MIENTNADCKITNITIQQSTALISCVIFSSASTNPAEAFKFYMRDIDTEQVELLSEKIYWVDYTNSALGTKNINVNKYAEILLTIDITNNNTSKIKDRHWVRECEIYLVNTKDISTKYSWKSNVLTLVSAEFEIPKIKYQFQKINSAISDNDDRYNINTVFKLEFGSNKNFSYDYKQFKIVHTVLDTTGLIPYEQEEFFVSDKVNNITSEGFYKIGDTIRVRLQIVDNLGNIYETVDHYYKVSRLTARCYVKTNDGVRKVLAIYKKVGE